MKLNATILMVMFLALSGFTWGAADETKSATNDAYNTASGTASNAASTYGTSAKKKSKSTSMGSSYGSSQPSGSTSSGESRVTAMRALSTGDEATRKARLESLTRLAKSMGERRKAAEASKASANSYQY